MTQKYYDDAMKLLQEIYDNFSEEDKEWFKNTNPILMHHDLGRHLRNHCKMWEIKWDSEMIDDVDHSPNHPDAVSSRAIRDFQASINGKPWEINWQRK